MLGNAQSNDLPVFSSSDVGRQHAVNALVGYKRVVSGSTNNIDEAIGTKYQFRAECERDANLFMHAISAFIESPWKMISDDSGYCLPDVEVTFRLIADVSYETLLWVASTVVDAHTIVQTLEVAVEYTGERDYGRKLDVNAPELMPSAEILSQVFISSGKYAERLRFLANDAREHVRELERHCRL